MRAAKAKLSESRLDLRNTHEQLPQQPAAVILDHRDDWALTDRDEGVRVPGLLLAEALDEPITSPDAVTEILIEVAQRTHGLLWSIGEARQRGRRRDDTEVIVGC